MVTKEEIEDWMSIGLKVRLFKIKPNGSKSVNAMFWGRPSIMNYFTDLMLRERKYIEELRTEDMVDGNSLKVVKISWSKKSWILGILWGKFDDINPAINLIKGILGTSVDVKRIRNIMFYPKDWRGVSPWLVAQSQD